MAITINLELEAEQIAVCNEFTENVTYYIKKPQLIDYDEVIKKTNDKSYKINLTKSFIDSDQENQRSLFFEIDMFLAGWDEDDILDTQGDTVDVTPENKFIIMNNNPSVHSYLRDTYRKLREDKAKKLVEEKKS